MLTIDRVSKRFADGTVALRDISLKVNEGDFIVLLGPSGCGKSTLLRLLAGLDRPTAGNIAWDGGRAPAAGETGFVFQDATLLPWATAAENVYLPLRLRGRRKAAAAGEVAAALAQVGLRDFAGARPRALSGGMRMRVSIARALVSDPRLLLLDEPFAALDEFTRHRLQEDLRGLCQGSGKTVVFVTHSIYEAAFLANRIFVLSPRPGQVAAEIETGTAGQPGSRVSADYVALVRRISETLRQAMPV